MYREDRKNNYRSKHRTETVEAKEKPLPPYLYYGTGTDFFTPREGEDIYPECGDTHVHLYDSILPAVCLGATRGEPVIYLVNSGKMAEDGFKFYLSANNVWLTDRVPTEYLEKAG